MRARDRFAQAVLVGGAVAAVAVLVRGVRAALEPLKLDGVGAISVGVLEAIIESILIIFVLVAINIGLRGVARRRGQLATRFRAIHFWATLCGLPGWIAITVWLGRAATLDAETFSRAWTTAGIVGAAFLGLQVFFAGSVLAFAVGHPASRTPAAR